MPPLRRYAALILAGLATPVASAGQQVCTDHDLLYRLSGETFLWNDVKGVATNHPLLAVLTESNPAIHLFDLANGTWHRSWGKRGEGPGEFRSSTGIALIGLHVYALDIGQDRLSIFDFTGNVVRTVKIQDLDVSPSQALRRLEQTERGTVLIELAQRTGKDRIIIAQTIGPTPTADSHQDTVTAFAMTDATDLQLVAVGSPSYTLPPPYSSVAQWTPIADGLALWQGPEPEIQILDLDGTVRSTLSLDLADRFEITAEDREHWLQNAIPQEFMGQKIFEPVREQARQTVDFPQYHPPVFELLSGPGNLLWIRRTPNSRETQIWDVTDSRGRSAGQISLSPGQRLMAVIPDHLLLRSTDEFGVESVEVHRCASY